MPNVSIYEKIVQKGVEDAKKILTAGEETAQSAMKAALAEAKDRNDGLMEKTREKNAILAKTRMTEFQQQSRQELLTLKKRLMDEVLSVALKKMQSLPDPEWSAFVVRTLQKDALSGNETIVASPADRKRFVSLFAAESPKSGPVLLDRLNQALNPSGIRLTLSDKTAPVEGGFFVEGTDFDIDHSYPVLLTALKDQVESELAALLFEGE